MWLAGGGVKGGQVIGATDAVGLRAAEGKTHVHDLHATILHLLGLQPHEADLPPQRPQTTHRQRRRSDRRGNCMSLIA